MIRFCALLLVSLTLGGCATSADFEISVRNETSEPFTIGTVKYGPPLEPQWASPEDVAIRFPNRPDSPWGAVVRPGQNGTIRISGKFSRGSTAFLRVYLGEATLSQLLATGRWNSERVDVPLYRGENRLVVFVRAGKLVGERLVKPGLPASR